MPEEDKVFTQADLDRVVGERLARHKSQSDAKIADLQNQLNKAVDAAKSSAWTDELNRRGITEEQLDQLSTIPAKDREIAKIARERDGLAEKLAESDKSLKDLGAQVTRERIQREITAAAAGRAVDPQDLVLRLSGQMKVGDDGVVTTSDGKSVADAVGAVLKDAPHLAVPTKGVGSGVKLNGTGGGKGGDKGPDLLTKVGRLAAWESAMSDNG